MNEMEREKYDRLRKLVMLAGVAMLAINLPVLYYNYTVGNLGPMSVVQGGFALLGLGVLLVRGDLAGRDR